MPPLFILRLHGDRVLSVSTPANATLAPRSSSAARELALLAATAPEDACIAWFDERLEPFLSDPAGWPDLLRNPLELLHLSCFQRCDRMVGSLGLVDFYSCFLLPGPTDRRYATWLVSPMAGIAKASLFRAGGFDGTRRSWTLALFDFGYRAMRHGLLPYSEPKLLRESIWPSVQEELERPLSPGQVAMLIRRMLGRKWVLFWLAAEAIYHQRFRGRAATHALLARPPPKADLAAFRRLHDATGHQSTPTPSFSEPGTK